MGISWSPDYKSRPEVGDRAVGPIGPDARPRGPCKNCKERPATHWWAGEMSSTEIARNPQYRRASILGRARE